MLKQKRLPASPTPLCTVALAILELLPQLGELPPDLRLGGTANLGCHLLRASAYIFQRNIAIGSGFHSFSFFKILFVYLFDIEKAQAGGEAEGEREADPR